MLHTFILACSNLAMYFFWQNLTKLVLAKVQPSYCDLSDHMVFVAGLN